MDRFWPRKYAGVRGGGEVVGLWSSPASAWWSFGSGFFFWRGLHQARSVCQFDFCLRHWLRKLRRRTMGVSSDSHHREPGHANFLLTLGVHNNSSPETRSVLMKSDSQSPSITAATSKFDRSSSFIKISAASWTTSWVHAGFTLRHRIVSCEENVR